MVKRFIISGRVQGVFFRASTRAQAEQLGVTGYAMNLPDGRVEVIACGNPEQLQQLHDWLCQGPPQARVDRVEVHIWEAQSYSSFTVC